MESAVLLITYRRMETALRVFEQIRLAEPPRLYFASNAANPNDPEEVNKVLQVRGLLDLVDWPCEVNTLLREKHLNVKESVAGAIDWFFDSESEGIVLEDDCLPHPDFFSFCDEMLERYRNVPEVAIVGGTCVQPPTFSPEASYYFSKYVHIWGWATWKRTWEQYDRNLKFWPEWKASTDWARKLTDSVEERYWKRRFDDAYAGNIVTWDYQLLACVWRAGGLTVTPCVNLVSNIGFGPDSQFTKNPQSPMAAVPTHKILPLLHPTRIQADHKADRYDFDYGFEGRKHRMPWRMLRNLRKVLVTRILDPTYLALRNEWRSERNNQRK